MDRWEIDDKTFYDWHLITFLSFLFRMITSVFIHLRTPCDLCLINQLRNPNLAITEAGKCSCESLSKASSFSSVPSQNRPLLLSRDQRYSRVVYGCYSPAGFGILSIKSWVCGWATTKIKSFFSSIETQFSVLTFCAFKTFESTWIDREFFLFP